MVDEVWPQSSLSAPCAQQRCVPEKTSAFAAVCRQDASATFLSHPSYNARLLVTRDGVKQLHATADCSTSWRDVNIMILELRALKGEYGTVQTTVRGHSRPCGGQTVRKNYGVPNTVLKLSTSSFQRALASPKVLRYDRYVAKTKLFMRIRSV